MTFAGPCGFPTLAALGLLGRVTGPRSLCNSLSLRPRPRHASPVQCTPVMGDSHARPSGSKPERDPREIQRVTRFRSGIRGNDREHGHKMVTADQRDVTARRDHASARKRGSPPLSSCAARCDERTCSARVGLQRDGASVAHSSLT